MSATGHSPMRPLTGMQHFIPYHLLSRNVSASQSRFFSASSAVHKTAGWRFNSHPQEIRVPSRRLYSDNRATSQRSQKQEVEAPKLSHLTESGEAHMISISQKIVTFRQATAVATLLFSKGSTFSALDAARNKKGDAIAVARVAAIQAAKKTADLIPLAHPSLGITGITVEIDTFQGSEKRHSITTHETTKEETVLPLVATLQEVSRLDACYGGVQVKATVACEGKTGVEMEALTAAAMGAMTLYDMLKGVDKALVITGCQVVKKEGGKSGGWEWDERTNQLVKTT